MKKPQKKTRSLYAFKGAGSSPLPTETGDPTSLTTVSTTHIFQK